MEIIKAEIPAVVVGHDEEAIKERDELLVKAATFVTVRTASEADRVSRHCQSLKRLVSDTEKDRKALKAPVNTIGKAIDLSAKEFVARIHEELKRLGGLVTAWDTAERERIEAEKLKAELEKQKKLAEAREAEEQAKKAAEAATESEAGLSEAESALLAQEEADRKKAEAEAAIREKEPETKKVSGTIRRMVTRWVIEDKAKVFAAHPEWFEIVPKKATINERVFAGMEVPGMKIWEEVATSFRS